MARSLFSHLYAWAAEALDRRVHWHRLPVPLGLAALIGLRERLRERNLYDTSPPASEESPPEGERYLTTRTADGRYNDLESPAMGSAGMPFGRNIPLEHAYPESDWAIVNKPNPRTVSRELLTRNAFKPATTLNMLAAAWIQFMVRDWFSHERGSMKDPWELRKDDQWPGESIKIPRTPKASRSPDDTSPPAYSSIQTHWWDGSQIYGSEQEAPDKVRTNPHGKLKIGLDGLPAVDSSSGKHPADEAGFWLGLAMMHTLFTREHNAICDRLSAEYPHWTDDDLFHHAWLINVALIAKIHTVEWTPAILGHPTLQVAMRANWWGLATEQVYKLFGRISKSEVISGIPGSAKDHFGVPYSLTEEFGAVYRMHPLIRDEYTFRSVVSDEVLKECRFAEVAGRNAIDLMRELPVRDLFYSFGISHPGALTLHNYPRSLQYLERLIPPDERQNSAGPRLQDLAATDILRMREFGVPRYNEFRELLHLPRVKSFEELTDNQPGRRRYGAFMTTISTRSIS